MKYILNESGSNAAAASAAGRRPRRRVGADYAPDGGGEELTRHQKAALCILAREAWEASGHPGAGADVWRQAEADRVVGRRISVARKGDFVRLKAHFLDVKREYGAAFRTLLRGEDNKRRIARHRLDAECKQRGLALAYPAAICRTQYKCGLDEATAPQLWRLVFTVRNRRKA